MAKSKIPSVSFRDMWKAFVEPPERPAPAGPMYDKIRSCKTKVAHLNVAKAEAARDAANKTNTGEYVFYKCRWCAFYHVGHKPE